MNTLYEDFYSEYISIHNKADTAYGPAAGREVSSTLINVTNEALEIVNNSKITGDNDNTIATYNNAIDDVATRLTSLNSFAKCYEFVEAVYEELSYQLDDLRLLDNKFKKKIKNEPKENMYKIKTDDGEIIDRVKHNMAINTWKKEILLIKKEAKSQSENVLELIKYLNSFNGTDPISNFTDTPRPTLSNQTMLQTKHWENNTGNSYYLDGKELEDFVNENHIMNPDDAKILKRTINVNGIPIDTYTIYNINDDYDMRSFNNYVHDSLHEEEKIDPRILKSIFDGDNKSSIIFLQDYDQERNYNPKTNKGINACGYYSPITNNITMLYCAGYYPSAIIHETGHAFDVLVASNKNMDNVYYSKLKWNDIVKEESSYFDESCKKIKMGIRCLNKSAAEEMLEIYFPKIKKDKTYEIYEEDGDWRIYISNNNSLDSNGVTIDGQPSSGYTVADYGLHAEEYFADVFEAYWSGDHYDEENGGISKLEYLCPRSYEAIYNLISEENSNN